MNKYNAILGGGPSWIVHPSDLAPALVSYNAEVTIEGPGGERVQSLEDFYTLPSEGDVTRETTLGPNEILTRVTIPGRQELHPQQARATYMKVRERGAFDFALSAVAVAIWRVGREIRQARVTLGGVAPKPWRVPRAEQELIKRPLGEEAFRAAADAALLGADPLEHNEYKIPMTRGLLIKALRKLTEA
jgi:xanthine dehydrogenase YagS FAD-binding subunit